MQPSDLEKTRRWASTWQEAGAALQRREAAELRHLDTVRAVASLASAFEYALSRATPRGDSGLVEQQRYFLLLAR